MMGGSGRMYTSQLLSPRQIRRSGAGFTIIEVLIVLAITSALLVSAVFLINGKQQKTSFDQSIRNIQTELQQIANDVSSGYYQNDGTIHCESLGGVLTLTSTGADLGTNSGCIFLGKMVQYGVMPITDPQTYNIYTIAGLRGDQMSPSTNYASAHARLIAKSSTEGASSIPDVYDTKKLQYGLSLSKIYYNNTTVNSVRAFGFASSLQNSIGSADTSQQVDVVVIAGSGTVTKPAAVTDINRALIGTPGTTMVVNPPNGVQLCFNSGGTQQSGLITVGGDGRQAGLISLRIYSTKDCA